MAVGSEEDYEDYEDDGDGEDPFQYGDRDSMIYDHSHYLAKIL